MEKLFSDEPVFEPQMFGVADMAEILQTSEEQIFRWIADEEVPYAEVPPRSGEFRLPLQSVLVSLHHVNDMNTGEPFMKPVQDMLRRFDENSEHLDIRED